MNPDLNTLQSNAQGAASSAASMASSAPQLLESLRTNLTNIFAKDNPLMKERENALSTFLSTPDTTRASLLPGNLPTVEGSPLNLSPTQQNAIVSSRRSAAFAPLASLNNIITGIYGNIPSLVQNAGNIYGSAIQGAQSQAELARQAYQDAVQQSQFQQQEARLRASAGGAGDGGLGEALLAILGNRMGGQEQGGQYDEAALDEILFGTPQTPNIPGLDFGNGLRLDQQGDNPAGLNDLIFSLNNFS